MKARSFAAAAVCLMLACSLPGVSDARHHQDREAVQHAVRLIESGRAGEAIPRLRPSADRHGGDVEAPLLLGIALNAIGDHAGAEVALMEARQLDPSNVTVRHQLAMSRLGQRLSERARIELEAVLAAAPGTPDVGLHLGKIYYERDELQRAEAALAVNVASSPELAHLASLYLGLIRERTERVGAARAAYLQAVTVHPGAPKQAKAQAQQHLAHIDRGVANRKVSVLVQFGAHYDSNAFLAPRTNVFGLRNQRRESPGFFHFIQPEIQLHKGKQFEAHAHYAGTFVHNTELSRFDLDDHQLGLTFLGHGKAEGKPLIFTLGVAQDFIDVGDRRFQEVQSVTPGVTLVHSPRSRTTLFSVLAWHHFAAVPMVRAEERDGDLHSIGFFHQWTWDKGHRSLKLSCLVDRDNTEGQDYDYRGYQPGLGYTLTTRHGLNVIADLQYHVRDYYEPNVVFNTFREDHETTVSLRLNQPLKIRGFHGLSTFISAIHTRSRSTVPLFDYERDVATLGVSYAH